MCRKPVSRLIPKAVKQETWWPSKKKNISSKTMIELPVSTYGDMKAYGGHICKGPHILNSGHSKSWDVRFMFQPLLPWHLMHRILASS
jgi:hypothetical protein